MSSLSTFAPVLVLTGGVLGFDSPPAAEGSGVEPPPPQPIPAIVSVRANTVGTIATDLISLENMEIDLTKL